MANILVNIEKNIEIAASDILNWLTAANKSLHVAPTVAAGLGTLIGAIEKPIADVTGVVANPLNISLDVQTVTDLKAVWSDIVAFMTSLGVKI